MKRTIIWYVASLPVWFFVNTAISLAFYDEVMEGSGVAFAVFSLLLYPLSVFICIILGVFGESNDDELLIWIAKRLPIAAIVFSACSFIVYLWIV